MRAGRGGERGRGWRGGVGGGGGGGVKTRGVTKQHGHMSMACDRILQR